MGLHSTNRRPSAIDCIKCRSGASAAHIEVTPLRLVAIGSDERDQNRFEVKTPAESKGDWDLYNQLATVLAAEAFFAFEESGCKLTN
jgi:hypothetical protein